MTKLKVNKNECGIERFYFFFFYFLFLIFHILILTPNTCSLFLMFPCKHSVTMLVWKRDNVT